MARASLPAGLRSAGFTVRDAWRSLKSTPAVSLFVIAVLTLGISAATVTLSVVDTVVLRPLPFPDPDRLAVIRVSSRLARNTATSIWRGTRRKTSSITG